ncbi:hypothetical protein [Streptomyces virginiae]|nr:hypothetical protein [Streptomyces virginiae]
MEIDIEDLQTLDPEEPEGLAKCQPTCGKGQTCGSTCYWTRNP